jgi:HSP20 family protein
MSYIKIRFGNSLDNLGSGINRSIEEILGPFSPIFALSERKWKPFMDIYESETDIIVVAEIAGIDKDDLELEISNKAMRISGERKSAQLEGNPTYRLAEIQYGSFERILYLPAPIDVDRVTATYTNGLLRINMAKLVLDRVQKIQIEGE